MALRPVGEMSLRNIFADTTSEGSLQVQDQRQTETELRVAHALVGNIREWEAQQAKENGGELFYFWLTW